MSRARTIDAGLAALLLSVLAHASAVLWLTPAAAERAASAAEPYRVPFEAASLTGAAIAGGTGRQPTERIEAAPGGRRSAQNVSARDRGDGGDGVGPRLALRMLHRDDGVVLFDSPLNNLAAAQTQRIRTARDRATRERRRATPNPDDQPFLASGRGVHRERRPVSERDAADGARRAPSASVEGARPEAPTGARFDPARAAGSAQGGSAPTSDRPAAPSLLAGGALAGGGDGASAPAGTTERSPGVGILGGRGARRAQAADVAHGRPPVDRGPAATPAQAREARVRDNADAELLASAMIASWTESTTRSGRRETAGRGGVGGGGEAGSGGGSGQGGRARAVGVGTGPHEALDTSDARYRRWFILNRRRILDALEFPRERALAMDQGTSLYRIRVRRDGTLAARPRLVRSSGFDDLDGAALAAIEQAAPFTPVPRDLAPGLARLDVSVPIQFWNPMVR